MGKKKGGILRREKIKLDDGSEIEVDTFDARVIVGSGKELESIDELLRQEEQENMIQDALKRIDNIAKRYPDRYNDIRYCYAVGKVLQFVDTGGFQERRGLVWQRMAYDLRPDLFGEKKSQREAKRYPETMYHLGKQTKEIIARATFDQWYEILKFKNIYEDRRLLEDILRACEEGLSSIQLRQRIKDLRSHRKAN
jgi:nicotinamide mononucleotide adenylyltransferase